MGLPSRPTLCVVLLAGCAATPPSAPPPPPPRVGQPLVAVDVDGTLTPRDLAFLEPRDNASQVLALYAQRGYRVVYLTARVPGLQSGLPDWLRRNGFPEGPLHIAPSADARADIARYKAQVLQTYAAQGWRLAYAYGDSSTDFQAYAAAGLPASRVFALKRRGDAQCQPGAWSLCLDEWSEHLPWARQLLPPAR